MDLEQFATTPNLTLDQYLAQLYCFSDDDEDSDSIAYALVLARRFDLLEQLTTHEDYGESAIVELRIHRNMERMHKEWDEKVSKYPEIFKKWQEVLDKWYSVTCYNVSYPSNFCKERGLVGNYVAIAGDGLFMFAFEILNNFTTFKLIHNPSGKDNSYAEEKITKMELEYDKEMACEEVLVALRKYYET